MCLICDMYYVRILLSEQKHRTKPHRDPTLELVEVLICRGGFGSGGSGFGEIRCPSVENKFTDNPSANRPLIGLGGRVG